MSGWTPTKSCLQTASFWTPRQKATIYFKQTTTFFLCFGRSMTTMLCHCRAKEFRQCLADIRFGGCCSPRWSNYTKPANRTLCDWSNTQFSHDFQCFISATGYTSTTQDVPGCPCHTSDGSPWPNTCQEERLSSSLSNNNRPAVACRCSSLTEREMSPETAKSRRQIMTKHVRGCCKLIAEIRGVLYTVCGSWGQNPEPSQIEYKTHQV